MKTIIIQKGLFLDKIAYLENKSLKKIKIISKNQKYFEKDIFLAKKKKHNISMKSLTLSLDENTEGFIHYKNQPQQEYVLCQIKKVYNNDKNIKLTDEITLIGKYIVYIKGSSGISISSKSDNNYLIDIFKQNINDKILQSTKIILRSHLKEEDIKNAIEELYQFEYTYEKIKQKAKLLSKPQLLYRQYEAEELFLSKINKTTDNLITNSKEVIQRLKKSIFDINLIEYEDGELFKKYGIDENINTLLQDKIVLKNRINLYIQKTEAMCIIDVNSGGYLKYKDKNQNAYHINSLVLPYIANQIILRDISGIIIIDFIEMNSDKLSQALMKKMYEYLLEDDRKSSVISMYKSSLMQIIRKKEDLSISEILQEQSAIKLSSHEHIFEEISQKLLNLGYPKDSINNLLIHIPTFESLNTNKYIKNLEEVFNIKITPIYLKKSDFNIKIN